ncbi:hypothetical protein PHYSODRAFT_527374 [Phytophthora sojae]|uniref:NADH:flavin oxidoreductase/NADH oxidase N-terminal domain-containing protein n=1 Tax=Phytophthora sojae (strain P6497) TaxID=1094619 RepID=G5A8C1_PHYSP|nr:hypothetical protein PHYSODRAFT_527374 [Phytophthora sojae]EGZ08147.1 hypothetical protein PHYSODRAFT_527374 [Phytophthora sojae]|eukprot:XP_009536319.1 hypothetical protein PHYSODRAFT_527374 [Phytophthora sojae]
MTLATLSKLFTAATLGGKKSPIELKHRVVMSPMTRLRMGDDGVPGPVVVEFYTQRASDGGLLITEGTNISATARGYYGAPGIFNEAQVEGWKAVMEKVLAKGGKIFVQLWHTGRVGHPLDQPNGELPVCSSAVSMEGVHSLAPTREGRLPHPVPRALETDEIAGIVADYKSAALKALEAGFDGVELHCANSYLMEQFLCDSINKRTDQYGASVENRARILFEALEAVLSGVDSSKVGIRISPYGTAFGCTDSAPGELFGYVIEKLNDYDLAYLHLVEPRGIQAPAPDAPEGGVLPIFRKIYKGFIITASGYDREEAIKVVEEGAAGCVAFARDFISNPDLVERLKIGAELNTRNNQTAYLPLGVPFETGYTDYPFLADSKKE